MCIQSEYDYTVSNGVAEPVATAQDNRERDRIVQWLKDKKYTPEQLEQWKSSDIYEQYKDDEVIVETLKSI